MRRGACFASVFGFYKGFEVGQARAPETAVVLQPGVDGAQRFRIELVNAVASFAMLADQVRAPQQAQVLGNRGTGHRKSPGNVSSRLATSPQHVEDGAARGIGERLESRLRVPDRRICNRTVPHNA